MALEQRSDGESTFVVGPCSPAETGDLVALFRRCYAPLRTIFQPRTPRRWEWKYGANPGGSASCAARSGHLAVAHVGGVAFRFRLRGAPRRTIQATDHMVDPTWRRGLLAGKVFRELMGAWVDRHCGRNAHIVAWGFPSRFDFRLGQRFFGYAHLGPVRVLVHDSIRALAGGARRAARADPLLDAARLDELWRRCSTAFPLVHERDAAYLRWRYAAHPAQRYRALGVSAPNGELRALGILRRGGLADDAVTVLEWLVDPADEEANAELIGLVAAQALQLGCGSIAIWLAPWQPAHAWLRRAGFAERESALCHTARTWEPQLSLADLRDDCPWSLGDVDFL